MILKIIKDSGGTVLSVTIGSREIQPGDDGQYRWPSDIEAFTLVKKWNKEERRHIDTGKFFDPRGMVINTKS